MRRGQSSTIIHEDSWALLGLGRGEVPFQIQGRKEAGKSSLGVSLFDLDWDERVNAYFFALALAIWPCTFICLQPMATVMSQLWKSKTVTANN